MNLVFNYWIWLFVSITIQTFQIADALEERGRFAVGGEWFIVPLIMLIVYEIRKMIKEFKEMKVRWDYEEEDTRCYQRPKRRGA